MSNNSGGTSSPVRLEHFRTALSVEEAARALRYVGKDHHLSLLYLADGKFTLRGHDEFKTGGYELVATSAIYVPAVASLPVVFTEVSQLPTSFPQGTGTAIIDMDLSAGSVDLSTWQMAAAQGPITLRIRKIDASEHKITWTDHIGIVYDFVDRRGEFISLAYDDTTGLMHIV